MSIPLNPDQPQQPQPQQPPASNMGFAKVPVSLSDSRTGFGTGVFGGRQPPAPPAPPAPPPPADKAPPPLPVKVPPALTADAPAGPAQVPVSVQLPSVKDLCARYPELATTVLCRRDSEGTLNLSPECLATLRDGLAAGLSLDALRAHERCSSFAELLVPVASTSSALAVASPALAADAATAVKSAGAVADACYTHFLGLSTDAQARILEDGVHGAYAVCQQAAAMLRRGQTAAARAAADWLYASFARTSPVLVDFCAAVANAAGLRPAGYVAFASRPMALAARTPTYSVREWVRPSGDPPAADMTFTLAETQAPTDPWAGLAGGGLGPAYNPTTGQQFNPATGQPIPGSTSPDYSAALAGLGAGATALVGGYLRGEQATQIAAAQSQATTTAALAQAQAARDVATINAQRDLALAQLRGTSDPGAQAQIQLQLNALAGQLAAAQERANAAPTNTSNSSNVGLYVGGAVVAVALVGGLAYAFSGSSGGRKHNGRSGVHSRTSTVRRSPARGR